MTHEELTSRVDQAWEEIKQYRATLKLLGRFGCIPSEAVKPGADMDEVKDLEQRVIRACAILVFMELKHREGKGVDEGLTG